MRNVLFNGQINPPMAKWGGRGGGGEVDATPNRFSQFCWEWGELFLQSNFFSCRLILGTSVHEKNFQMETAVLALKLDKGKVLDVATPPPPPLNKSLPIFLAMNMAFNLIKFWYELR